MASKTIITMVDDLDQKSTATHTAVFAWDGKQFEIDLTQSHYDEMEAAFGKYVAAARMVGRTQLREKRPGRPKSPLPTRDILPESILDAPARSLQRGTGRDREQLQAIRQWATNNGYTVSDRGRIPAAVEEAYEKAHTAEAMAATG